MPDQVAAHPCWHLSEMTAKPTQMMIILTTLAARLRNRIAKRQGFTRLIWAQTISPLDRSRKYSRYYEKYPESLRAIEQQLGYRVRPSLVWQRKRYGTMELIVGIANDGVAGAPGVFRVYAESLDGKITVGGNLDAGEPRPSQIRQASLILPKGMDGQQIILRAELEVKGVRRPVRWAC